MPPARLRARREPVRLAGRGSPIAEIKLDLEGYFIGSGEVHADVVSYSEDSLSALAKPANRVHANPAIAPGNGVALVTAH